MPEESQMETQEATTVGSNSANSVGETRPSVSPQKESWWKSAGKKIAPTVAGVGLLVNTAACKPGESLNTPTQTVVNEPEKAAPTIVMPIPEAPPELVPVATSESIPEVKPTEVVTPTAEAQQPKLTVEVSPEQASQEKYESFESLADKYINWQNNEDLEQYVDSLSKPEGQQARDNFAYNKTQETLTSNGRVSRGTVEYYRQRLSNSTNSAYWEEFMNTTVRKDEQGNLISQRLEFTVDENGRMIETTDANRKGQKFPASKLEELAQRSLLRTPEQWDDQTQRIGAVLGSYQEGNSRVNVSVFDNGEIRVQEMPVNPQQ